MNQHHYHAVVWIDHHEARVFHFSPTDGRPFHHRPWRARCIAGL
jgi:hypothetical protein